MERMELKRILELQDRFFKTEITKSIGFRKESLKLLKQTIQKHEKEVLLALNLDLNKSNFEAYATEIGQVYEEINYFLKHLDKWARTERVKTSVIYFHAKSRIYKEPYGKVLILSPWNYPFQLAMMPLIGAIGGGNTAIVKPSNYAAHTAKVVDKILTECFHEEFVKVVLGGREENQILLEEKFDKIFFTGSGRVGKVVLEKASQNLTPVVLELGGKSPCIIDKTANIRYAAKRIAWGKLVNAGQTCVAPDHVFVHESVMQEFIEEYKKAVFDFYPTPLDNEEYPKIINEKHFERLLKLLQQEQIIFGGGIKREQLKIAPTLVEVTHMDSPLMEEEIFGPILPLIPYKSLKKVVDYQKEQPKPLALYLFTSNKAEKERIVGELSFGGGVINDTIIHVAGHEAPFGGVGESGMGNYHGKASYETFTHRKSIVDKSLWLDLPLRYPPYKGKTKYTLLKKTLK